MRPTDSAPEERPKGCSALLADEPCPHPPVDGEAHCILHLPDEAKDKELFLSTFEEEVSRQADASAAEPATLDLAEFVFPVELDLRPIVAELGFERIVAPDARFESGVHLVGLELAQGADFRRAVFAGPADFMNVRFAGQADFLNAKFEAGAHFDDAEFGEAIFAGTVFSKPADFVRTSFKRVDFTEADLGDVYFSDVDLPRYTKFWRSKLAGAEFRGGSVVGALFNGSVGLEQCRFSHVRWHKRRGRWVLAEEVFIRWPAEAATPGLNLKDLSDVMGDQVKLEALHRGRTAWAGKQRREIAEYYQSVEKTYRQLKANYENEKNYPDAGNFHFGEMEMKRFAEAEGRLLRRSFASLEWYYSLLSGYGERWMRSLAAFLLVVLVSALLYSWQGFTTQAPNPVLLEVEQSTATAQRPLEKAVFLEPDRLSDLRHVSSTIGQSLVFSLRVALLRPDSFAQSLSPTTTLFVIFETVLGPLTLALLVLAIRRRFRRS